MAYNFCLSHCHRKTGMGIDLYVGAVSERKNQNALCKKNC